jgi:hypothetical protein
MAHKEPHKNNIKQIGPSYQDILEKQKLIWPYLKNYKPSFQNPYEPDKTFRLHEQPANGH